MKPGPPVPKMQLLKKKNRKPEGLGEGKPGIQRQTKSYKDLKNGEAEVTLWIKVPAPNSDDLSLSPRIL